MIRLREDLVALERTPHRLHGAARHQRVEADHAGDRLRDEDLEPAGLERLDDRVRDVLGLDGLEPARRRQAGAELGVDDHGHHDADLDVRLAQLGADRLAQPDHGVLGGAVRRAAGEAGLAGRRGDLDEVAAVARQEALERELRAVDQTDEVDVDHPLRGRVGLLDERTDRHDPRVVDEDVEGAESRLDLVEEASKARSLGHIERQPDGAGAELLSRLLRQARIDVADRDPRALSEKRHSRCAADAACAPGDCDNLTGKRSWDLRH